MQKVQKWRGKNLFYDVIFGIWIKIKRTSHVH